MQLNLKRGGLRFLIPALLILFMLLAVLLVHRGPDPTADTATGKPVQHIIRFVAEGNGTQANVLISGSMNGRHAIYSGGAAQAFKVHALPYQLVKTYTTSGVPGSSTNEGGRVVSNQVVFTMTVGYQAEPDAARALTGTRVRCAIYVDDKQQSESITNDDRNATATCIYDNSAG